MNKAEEVAVVVKEWQFPTVTEVIQEAFELNAFRELEGEYVYRVRFADAPPRWYISEGLEKALAQHLNRCWGA